MDSETSKQLQIRLVTTQESIAVPSLTLSVPAKIDPEGLEKLVRQLLAEDSDRDERTLGKRLQFVVLGDFLRGPLIDSIAEKDVGVESAVEVHYHEISAAPEPGSSANHDDWVAGVACRGEYVLTACYDNTVNIFSVGPSGNSAEKRLTIPGHVGPARAVAWIGLDGETGTFASSSHDQTVMLYKWDVKSNSIAAMNACRGHERSVDCLAINPAGTMVASGSFDHTLKVWGASVQENHEGGGGGEGDDDGGGESEGGGKSKRAKGGPLTRTPIMTLAGHKEGVSGAAWMSAEEVATSSWDHTIKIWDVEMAGMKSEMVGNKSFFALSYSPLNGTLIAASADSAVRLFDPRSKDGGSGVIVKAQYTSHQGWVTSVFWSREREHLFVSGAHDNLVKMWDWRSYRTPLFDLKGHTDKVLCCDWGEVGSVASGGADNAMKTFKTNC